MPIVTAEPNLVFAEDVSYGAANSEALFNKIGATHNYFLKNFDKYTLAITGGALSNIPTFPFASGGRVYSRQAGTIEDILISISDSGSSGTTNFEIQRKPPAGSFTTIFSTNSSISGGSGLDISFFALSGSTPSGVTKPVLSSALITAQDAFRIVLNTSAASAFNVSAMLIVRPTA